MRSKKDPLTTAQNIFAAAAPDAASLLVELLRSEEASVAQRLSCAESILGRALGKTGAPIKEEPAGIEVLFSPEAKECVK